MSWREEVIESISGRTGRGKYIRINCPACLDRVGKVDYDKSISINTRSGWWKCWRCNWRNRLDGFDDETESEWEDVEQEDAPLKMPSSYASLLYNGELSTHQLLRPGINYAKARNLSIDIIKEAEIGYSYSGEHRKRLILPVLGPFGWVGWTGRCIDDSSYIKYHTSEGFNRNKYLYGPTTLKDYVILTEGPIDCLRVWPYGISTLGKPTLEQLNTFIERIAGRPVVVALDGDSWREGIGIRDILRVHDVEAQAMILPPKRDLGGADRKDIISGAVTALSHRSTVDFR